MFEFCTHCHAPVSLPDIGALAHCPECGAAWQATPPSTAPAPAWTRFAADLPIEAVPALTGMKALPTTAASAATNVAQAQAHLARREYLKAIEALTRALEIDPLLAVACNERGRAYTATGDFARALVDLDAAIEIDPRVSA